MFSGFESMMMNNIFESLNNRKFEEQFRCYPISLMTDNIRKDEANYGGKIFLPSSSLSKLTKLNIKYPILFKLTNILNESTTHSGVLEFIAEEGRAYIPQWMMNVIEISPGNLIRITNCDLPLGNYVKIEPQSVDFLEISDPKAVLENFLRNFSTLTVNDIIEIKYNDIVYGIKILDVKPISNNNGICVVETDLETEFVPPVGYVEPDYKALSSQTSTDDKNNSFGTQFKNLPSNIRFATTNNSSSQKKFVGVGNKLKKKKNDTVINRGFHISNIDPNSPPLPLDFPENVIYLNYPVILPKKNLPSENNSNHFNSIGKKL